MSVRRTRLLGIMLAGMVFTSVAVDARGQSRATRPAFQPKITTILGSTRPNEAEAFTRIFNQKKGELAIRSGGFIATGGLTIDWFRMLQVLLAPDPIIGHMTLVEGRDVVHMVIRINFAKSNLLAGMIAAEFVVAEGTTVPIPIGSIFGGEFWQLIQDGIAGYDGHFTPEFLPVTREHAFTLTYMIVPGLVRNPSRDARIDISYEFVSVDPLDGSEPRKATPRETLLISR